MIIGHEITHGFDDQGRHMDSNGNMENWWGRETEENFAERSQCMEKQYSELEFAGMKLNGRLTLGENIADNGGIKIAYNAWVRGIFSTLFSFLEKIKRSSIKIARPFQLQCWADFLPRSGPDLVLSDSWKSSDQSNANRRTSSKQVACESSASKF